MKIRNIFFFYTTILLTFWHSQSFAQNNPKFIGHWAGEVVIKDRPQTTSERGKQAPGAYNESTYKHTRHPLALTLFKNDENILSGYVYYENQNCIFAIESVDLGPRINPERNLKIVEKRVLNKCEHKHILRDARLTTLNEQKLKVMGRFAGQGILQQYSTLSKQQENVFEEQLQKAISIQSKPKEAHTKPFLLNATGKIKERHIDFKFLFPNGLLTPSDVIIQVKGESPECNNAIYSQQDLNGIVSIESHSDNCDRFSGGRFSVNQNNNLKITWQPNINSNKQIMPDGLALTMRQRQKITGTMAQLHHYYLANANQLSLTEAVDQYLKTLQKHEKLMNDVYAQEAPFNTYGTRFIGSWQGAVEIDGTKTEAALALWTGKSGDYGAIIGHLALSETCFYNVNLHDENGKSLLILRKTGQNECPPPAVEIRSQFHTIANMDSSFKTLRFEYIPKGVRSTRSKVKAAFKRAAPTDYLLSIISRRGNNLLAPPDTTTLRLMSLAEVPGPITEQHYKQAMMESTELREQRIIEGREARAEAEAVALERYLKKREIEIEMGLRKPDRPKVKPQSFADVQPTPTVNGPFDGLPGANFLNAIYQGKPALVHRINENYALKQSKGLKTFFGSYGNQMTDALADMYKHVRIQDSVAAKYLFEYERYFGRCLSMSPAIFYVEGYQPDTVFTNLLGVEIARYYGGTSVHTYKVNQEFSRVFNQVGRMKPESVSANLTGTLASQGSSDLRKSALTGLEQMREKFSCDSKEIKTFERNLIALFN